MFINSKNLGSKQVLRKEHGSVTSRLPSPHKIITDRQTDQLINGQKSYTFNNIYFEL